jgi:hypothetical protein
LFAGRLRLQVPTSSDTLPLCLGTLESMRYLLSLVAAYQR